MYYMYNNNCPFYLKKNVNINLKFTSYTHIEVGKTCLGIVGKSHSNPKEAGKSH